MERTHQSVELVDSLPLCTHTVPKSGRHCRQSVAKPGGLLCATHAKQLALSAPPADPLAEIAAELGDLSEISEVSQFLAKILKLACQNRISISRSHLHRQLASQLSPHTHAEDRIAAKEPAELRIDWTGVPRPERDLARIRAQQPISDSPHSLVPA